MKIKTLIEKSYSPRVSIYLDDINENDKPEIASMLRGLKCAIEGWGSISGLTNDRFETESPLILEFNNTDNAHYFKNCVEYYFDETILQSLKVKKRIYK